MNQDAQRLYIDCEPPRWELRTVRPLGLVVHEWSDSDVPVARSLTQAALTWCWLLQHDYYAVDSNGWLNRVETNPVPEWILHTRIA
jgi:hypothetical protein